MDKEFEKEEREVNTRMIFVAEYQRPLDPKHVNEIIKEYNPNTVRIPRISKRAGKYWVFDGQHTIAALKQMNGGHDLTTTCEVYYGMTYEDEARQFALQNGKEKKVAYGDLLHSLYESKDIDVIDFKRLVEAHGFACDFKVYGGNNRLVCYKAAYTIYKQANGARRLADILTIIHRAWGGSADSIWAEMVNGMNVVLRDNVGKYNVSKMAEKLSRVSPIEIYRNAKAMVVGGNKRFAQQIVDVCNKNVQSNKRLIVKW